MKAIKATPLHYTCMEQYEKSPTNCGLPCLCIARVTIECFVSLFVSWLPRLLHLHRKSEIMNAFLQVCEGKAHFLLFFSYYDEFAKEGFMWVIWMSLLFPGWNCSLWSGGSLPGVFLAYVSCFLYRSEWPQFIVSYRWRAYFEIRYHSVSGFRQPVCSTCSYIPLSLTCEGVFLYVLSSQPR